MNDFYFYASADCVSPLKCFEAYGSDALYARGLTFTETPQKEITSHLC